jgi:hypothetical protein
MASKQGISVLLMLLALGSLAVVTAQRIYANASYACSPKCAAPSYCCRTNVCCRNASSVAADCDAAVVSTPIPHSDRVVAVDYGDEPWSEIDVLRTTSL